MSRDQVIFWQRVNFLSEQDGRHDRSGGAKFFRYPRKKRRAKKGAGINPSPVQGLIPKCAFERLAIIGHISVQSRVRRCHKLLISHTYIGILKMF